MVANHGTDVLDQVNYPDKIPVVMASNVLMYASSTFFYETSMQITSNLLSQISRHFSDLRSLFPFFKRLQ